MKKSTFFGLCLIYSYNLLAINVQQFSRSNSLTFEMIEDARLSSSHVINHYKWLFNLGFSHVDEPLTIKSSNNSEQVDSIIDSMQSIHLGAALYLKPWWQVAINTSFSHFKNNSDQTINDFQDIELKSKFRIYNGKRNAFTLMPIASIPLGGGETPIRDNSNPPTFFGTDDLLSDGGFGLGVFGIYEHLFRHFQISLNLGYKINSDAEFIDNFGVTQIDKTKVLTAGLGVYVPINNNVGVNLEYLTNFTSPFFNDNLNPSELFVGASGGLKENIHGFIGAGFGNFFSGNDGNDYRIVAGVKFTPGTKAKNYQKQKHTQVIKPSRIIEDYKEEDICKKAYLFEDTNALTILFNNNSHKISQKQKKKISELLSAIQSRNLDIANIKLYGHTSSVGDEPYNKNLGLNRAQEIKKILSSNNISIEKVKALESFGESKLLESENDNENKKVNRRVEVHFDLIEKYRGCYE